jgi:hypothetical protein
MAFPEWIIANSLPIAREGRSTGASTRCQTVHPCEVHPDCLLTFETAQAVSAYVSKAQLYELGNSLGLEPPQSDDIPDGASIPVQWELNWYYQGCSQFHAAKQNNRGA